MKYLLLFALVFSLSVSAQEISDKQIKENIARLDSQNARLNESIKQSMRTVDSINLARTTEQMGRNMDAFMAQRKEQEHKNMQRIYWRLGFGILMLVVFVIGIRRKKKMAA